MTLPPPGTHGGDAPSVARALGIDLADVLDLSQSLNPVAPDPVPVLARHVDAVRFYPDVRASTHLLAAAMGFEPERVLLTNGGAEAIALVGAEIGGRVVEPELGCTRAVAVPCGARTPTTPVDCWPDPTCRRTCGTKRSIHWPRDAGHGAMGTWWLAH